jgi:hypothetical protein
MKMNRKTKLPWKYIFLTLVMICIIIAIVEKVKGDTLRNFPRNVLLCSSILCVGTFLKWKRIKNFILQISTSVILILTGSFLIGNTYQREYLVTRNNIKMVACQKLLWDGQIPYYQYKNSFFYGKKLGFETYSIENKNPLSKTPRPTPLQWSFYDLEGNMIEKGSDHENETLENQQDNLLKQKAEIKQLDVTTIKNRKDELVFSISMTDFIDSYNGYYWNDQEERYLPPTSEWRSVMYKTSIHSNHETIYYNFTKNEKIWSLPSISVYVPTNGDYIQEVTIDFDDHSFTEEMHDLYEKMCFYALKVFFPQLENEKIIELYKTMNSLAYDNIFPNAQGYGSNPIPCALYYKDNIGIYPYFAIGESVHLCIIPVSQETLDYFEKKGVKIHEIL